MQLKIVYSLYFDGKRGGLQSIQGQYKSNQRSKQNLECADSLDERL